MAYFFAAAKRTDSYVYLNFDAADDWKMRESAQAAAKKIIDFIEAHIKVCLLIPLGNQCVEVCSRIVPLTILD